MPLVLNDFHRFTVSGTYLEQACVNIFDYQVEEIEGAAWEQGEALEALRAEWVSEVCPLLNEEYRVIEYRLARFENIVGTTPANIRPIFGEESVYAGEAADVGTLEGTPMPSYVAASASKKTLLGTDDVLYFPMNADPLPGTEKAFRGGTRYGAQTEESTQAPQGNMLTTAYRDLLQAAVYHFDNIILGTAPDRLTLNMHVLSLVRNGAIRTALAGAQAVGAFKPVVIGGSVVNTWVGSQLSRKYTGPTA